MDTAVGLVEEGRLEGAIAVLEQGCGVLGAAYPGRWGGGREGGGGAGWVGGEEGWGRGGGGLGRWGGGKGVGGWAAAGSVQHPLLPVLGDRGSTLCHAGSDGGVGRGPGSCKWLMTQWWR